MLLSFVFFSHTGDPEHIRRIAKDVEAKIYIKTLLREGVRGLTKRLSCQAVHSVHNRTAVLVKTNRMSSPPPHVPLAQNFAADTRRIANVQLALTGWFFYLLLFPLCLIQTKMLIMSSLSWNSVGFRHVALQVPTERHRCVALAVYGGFGCSPFFAC